MQGKIKTYLKKFTGWIIRIILSLALLMIALTLLLQLSSVQTFIAGEVLGKIKETTGAGMSLEKVSVVLPDRLSLKNVYVEDNNADTLLRAKRINVNIGLFKLLRKSIEIDRLVIREARVQLKRYSPDSTFNFSYIIDSLSDDSKKPEKNDKPFDFNIQKIRLDDIHFTFHDSIEKNKFFVRFEKFITAVSNFDPEQKQIVLTSLSLENSKTIISISEKKLKEPQPFLFDINLKNEINLKNTDFTLIDHFSKLTLHIKNKKTSVSPHDLDLPSKIISVEDIELDKADIMIRQEEMSRADSIKITEFKRQKPENPYDWQISSDKLLISNSSFAMDNENFTVDSAGFDAKHITVSGLSLIFEDLLVSPGKIAMKINELGLDEKHGFSLSNLSATITATDKQAELNDLDLKTSKSSIAGVFSLDYPPLEKLKEQWNDIQFNLDISNAQIDLADLLYFVPGLARKLPVFNSPENTVILKGRLKGNPGDLRIPGFYAAFDSTSLAVKGVISGLPDIKNTRANIRIDSLVTTNKNLSLIMPDTGFTGNIKPPPEIKLTGTMNGSRKNFKGSLDMQTTWGDIVSGLSVESVQDAGRQTFKGDIKVDDLELGQVFSISSDTIGDISLEAIIDGTLTEMSSPDAGIEILVKKAGLMGYTYNNMEINGRYNKENISGNAELNDTNLIFRFSGNAVMIDTVPDINFTFTLHGADFKQLNLSQSDLSASGMITAGFKGMHPDHMNGSLKARDIITIKNGKQYVLDSISASIENSAGETNVSVTSSMLNAGYRGSVKLTQLGSTVLHTMDRHFSLGQNKPEANDSLQFFQLRLNIFDTEMITEVILPKLRSFTPAILSADYNSREERLEITGDFPYINYNDIEADSLVFRLLSGENKADFSAGIDRIKANQWILKKTMISGNMASDSLFTTISVLDRNDRVNYFIEAAIHHIDTAYVINVQPDRLLLNNRNFSIPNNNEISFYGNKVTFSNFDLTTADQQISINSHPTEEDNGRIYTAAISGVRIDNLTGLFETQHDLLNGILNGTLKLSLSPGRISGNTDITINNLSLYGDTVFKHIHLTGSSSPDNDIAFYADFTDPRNNLTLNGTLGQSNNNTTFDMGLEIGRLELSPWQPLLKQQLSDLEGNISGNIRAVSTPGVPELNGNIIFSNTSVTPVFLNTMLNMEQNEITITKNEVILNDFTMLDERGNSLLLDGNVSFEDMKNIEYDMQIRSNDFTFLNTGMRPEELYYGTFIADINASLSGTAFSPAINAGIVIEENTDFYFMIPNLGTSGIEREGIVEFIDRSDTSLSRILERNLEKASTNIQNKLQLDLLANIDVNENAKLTIITDPSSDEKLEIRGDANLSLAMRETGEVNLTGRYKISNGSYTMKFYDVITRKFRIEEGSSILWTGSPTDANVNITAIYQTITSPLPLILAETDLTPEEQDIYNRNMTFRVYLHITDMLLEPTLAFELKQPPGQGNALLQSKIDQLNQNENELHKQAFSLLVFNSFMQEGTGRNMPVAHELNATARNSISNLITQQLNRYSQQYIKGFNVDVAVSSYYESAGRKPAGRTDVELNLSKELFNERLNVQIGSNINVEGDDRQTRNDISGITGDFSIEYKLNDQGTYILRGFNRTEYEDVLDGEVNKTGIAFILNKNFYRFRDLFLKKRDEE